MNTQMPIGVDDFKEVRENYYFVDKTHFIQSLIDGHSKVTLLTRPRRFGKTLTMSMLDYFFSLERESESLHLFDGLQIARAGVDYMKHRGQYPVLFMTFKGIQNDTWDLAFNAFQLVIQKEFQQHRYLLDSPELAPEEKQLYSRFLDNTATLAEYQISLLYLCEYLYRYYKIRPIILIDEYDAPIQNAYNHGFYDTAISYFRTFYNNTLKGNEFLNFAILTGVLRIAKESIFSGLNNLRVCSILDNAYADVMGFTEEELENYGFGVGSNTDSCENIYEKTDSDQEKEEQKKVRHEEDLTLIQGIIDVFWIEKDGIVLLDYKTDRVQQAKELIDRYETQLKLYADALERVFAARKLKVKEILIYSFSLEQLITL